MLVKEGEGSDGCILLLLIDAAGLSNRDTRSLID